MVDLGCGNNNIILLWHCLPETYALSTSTSCGVTVPTPLQVGLEVTVITIVVLCEMIESSTNTCRASNLIETSVQH